MRSVRSRLNKTRDAELLKLAINQRPWQRALAFLWASKPGAALLSRTLHWADRAMLALSCGRWTLAELVNGLPVVTLTTTGAKSGASRSIPTIAIPAGADVVLIGSNFGRRHYPAWYHNLRHNPRCRLTMRGKSAEYVAREVTDEAEYSWRWRRAVELYQGYASYRHRAGPRHIPILVLQPIGNS